MDIRIPPVPLLTIASMTFVLLGHASLAAVALLVALRLVTRRSAP